MTLDAITTVYSYYTPEVRAIVDRLVADYPHQVFLSSVKPGLDDFHRPIIARLVEWHRHDVPRLGDFTEAYPTSGSEEGIREVMTLLALRGTTHIHMFEGDYEGYREVARTRGIECVEMPFDIDAPARVAAGWWFLSNPSARDGNVLPRAIVEAVLAAGHQVFYDLSYLGSTSPVVFDLSHERIAFAAVSFSKPYGLFYYRIGFTFARQPIPALVANKWFKNVFGLLLADRLVQELDGPAHAARYKAIQATIVDRIEREHAIGLEPSDAFLIAHVPARRMAELDPSRRALLARFERAQGCRLCLTPSFLACETRP